MWRPLLCLFLVPVLLAAQGEPLQRDTPPPFREEIADSLIIEPANAMHMVAQQQNEDPIIGLWTMSPGGYRAKFAIVKNPRSKTDGYSFVGIAIDPLPGF